MDDLNEQLRAAVRAAPMTRAQLARESGVDQALLCNWFNRKRRRLGPDSIQQLCDALGLEIVLRPKQSEGKRHGKLGA